RLCPVRMRQAHVNVGDWVRAMHDFVKPLDELRKIGFVLYYTTIDCSMSFFYHKDCEPLALAAQRRGARIGPACAVLTAPVGRLQPIGREAAMKTRVRPRN